MTSASGLYSRRRFRAGLVSALRTRSWTDRRRAAAGPRVGGQRPGGPASTGRGQDGLRAARARPGAAGPRSGARGPGTQPEACGGPGSQRILDLLCASFREVQGTWQGVLARTSRSLSGARMSCPAGRSVLPPNPAGHGTAPVPGDLAAEGETVRIARVSAAGPAQRRHPTGTGGRRLVLRLAQDRRHRTRRRPRRHRCPPQRTPTPLRQTPMTAARLWPPIPTSGALARQPVSHIADKPDEERSPADPNPARCQGGMRLGHVPARAAAPGSVIGPAAQKRSCELLPAGLCGRKRQRGPAGMGCRFHVSSGRRRAYRTGQHNEDVGSTRRGQVPVPGWRWKKGTTRYGPWRRGGYAATGRSPTLPSMSSHPDPRGQTTRPRETVESHGNECSHGRGPPTATTGRACTHCAAWGSRCLRPVRQL